MSNYKIIIYGLFIIWMFNPVEAQVQETSRSMFWGSFYVYKKFNKTLGMSYFQVNSMNLQSGRMNFIQSDLSFKIKTFRHTLIGIHYTPTFSLDVVPNKQVVYHRVGIRFKYYHKIVRHVYMKHYVAAEHHFTRRAKWRQRFYYRLDLEYKNKRMMPLKMRPFIAQKIYWYQGGRLLQYYDSNGNKTDLLPPDGLHAYRIKTGLKLYPSDHLRLQVYYMLQKEFNSNLLGGNPIHSLNPNTGKIRRPFYNFHVWGLIIGYKL